jgi:hypothetical protein
MVSLSMKGEGFYDTYSAAQKASIEYSRGYIEEAAKLIDLPAGHLTIADYGCSEGQNSITLVSYALQVIRQRKSEQSVSVIHNDLPFNNFNRLFYNLNNHGYLQDEKGDGKVFSFASAASFYNQILPDNSVNMAFSASAINWLPQVPDYAIKDHIVHSGANAADSENLGVIAHEAWTKFLRAREREMVAGGKLVIVCPGRFEDGDSEKDLEQDMFACENMMNLLNSVIVDFVHSGKINKNKYDKLAFPIYLRSKSELSQPINQDVYLSKSFKIDRTSTHRVRSPFSNWADDPSKSEDFAQVIVNSVRAFSEPVLLQGLFDDKEEGQAVLELVYATMKNRVARQPKNWSFDPVMVFATFTKI